MLISISFGSFGAKYPTVSAFLPQLQLKIPSHGKLISKEVRSNSMEED